MKKLRMVAPPGYFDVPEEERNKRWEGCGPGHLGNLLVPDRLIGLSIRECCRRHDAAYEWGKSERDKKRADCYLLRNCTVLIYSSECRLKWLRRARMQRAFIYYHAVHLLGHHAFWQGKERAA